jgi:serine/threonine protein kinase
VGSATGDGGRVTSTEVTIGTPAYMAPEPAGDAHIDHRVDLYAAGLVM